MFICMSSVENVKEKRTLMIAGGIKGFLKGHSSIEVQKRCYNCVDVSHSTNVAQHSQKMYLVLKHPRQRARFWTAVKPVCRVLIQNTFKHKSLISEINDWMQCATQC